MHLSMHLAPSRNQGTFFCRLIGYNTNILHPRPIFAYDIMKQILHTNGFEHILLQSLYRKKYNSIMRWFHTYKDWLWFSGMKNTSDQIFHPYKWNTFNTITYLSMTISHLLLQGLLLFINWPEGINHSHTFLLSTCSQLFTLMHVYNLPPLHMSHLVSARTLLVI